MHAGRSNYNPLMTRLFALALAVLPALASAAPAAVTDRLSRTLPLPASRAIRIDATVADLTIVGSNRPDVAVEIARHAPAPADLAALPVVIESAGGAIHIAAVQRGGGREAGIRSEIVVRAPASAAFRAVRVFEGRVRISGITEACDVDLRRGAIEGEALAGRIRLEAGLGSVDVRDSSLTPGGMMRLRVFNGPLRVRFARPPVSARILAVTFNGALTSDIPLTMKDTFGPRFGETTLGAGDPVMSLDVVKGDIAISVDRR
jgi:hypothetical protein